MDASDWEEELQQQYGAQNFQTLLGVEVDLADVTDNLPICFLFVFGKGTAPEECIGAVLPYLAQKLARTDDLEVSIQPLLLNCSISSLWPSIERSIEDITCQNADIIPIIAEGFERMASDPTSRDIVAHDYVQDIVQNTTIVPALQASKKTLLIITPVHIDHEYYLTGLSRFGGGQFWYSVIYAGCTPDEAWQPVRDYKDQQAQRRREHLPKNGFAP
ncbi:MAG: hypothetical protein ACOYK8_09935 [Alphaproteobacteria bacterium]